jgi:hypothetical protein
VVCRLSWAGGTQAEQGCTRVRESELGGKRSAVGNAVVYRDKALSLQSSIKYGDCLEARIRERCGMPYESFQHRRSRDAKNTVVCWLHVGLLIVLKKVWNGGELGSVE